MVEEDPENIIMTCSDCIEKMYPNKGNFDPNVGDYVKMKFYGDKGNEYMWVKVAHIDLVETLDDDYKFEGTLDNDPVLVKDIKCGDRIRFRKEDILELLTPDQLL